MTSGSASISSGSPGSGSSGSGSMTSGSRSVSVWIAGAARRGLYAIAVCSPRLGGREDRAHLGLVEAPHTRVVEVVRRMRHRLERLGRLRRGHARGGAPRGDARHLDVGPRRGEGKSRRGRRFVFLLRCVVLLRCVERRKRGLVLVGLRESIEPLGARAHHGDERFHELVRRERSRHVGTERDGSGTYRRVLVGLVARETVVERERIVAQVRHAVGRGRRRPHTFATRRQRASQRLDVDRLRRLVVVRHGSSIPDAPPVTPQPALYACGST